MKILIVGINFSPELTGVGKYTGEMAEWLAERGHEVHVVTAPPYYPRWEVGEGYSPWRYRVETRSGTKVYRCPLWVPKNPSGLKRLVHLASFALTSLPVTALLAFTCRPDVLLIIEPPLLCAPAGWILARLARAQAWLHIQDFEVAAGFGLGLMPSSRRLRDFVEAMESRLMSRFNRVSTVSGSMLRRLRGKKLQEERLALFTNWVDTDRIFPYEKPSPLRHQLGIAPEAVIALCSGNMGEKQGLETLIEAGRLLAPQPNIRLIICGEGAARQKIAKLAANLPNLRLLPLRPADQLNDLLNMADIHILLQRDQVADLVMPSRLCGMLASGKPVVATFQRGTEVAKIVDLCGCLIQPGDSEGLVKAIRDLSVDPEKRSRLGRAGRDYAVKHWHKETVLARFENDLAGNGTCRRTADIPLKHDITGV